MSNGQSNKQTGPKPEWSTETRLLLAFALMGRVLFATPYFFKTVSPPAPAKKASTPLQPPAAVSVAAPPSVEPPKMTATPPVQPVAARKEETFVVDTDLYRVVFSNRGAVVQQWTLKKYTDDNGNPLELVNGVGAAKTGYPFQ